MGLFSSTRQPHTRCALICTAAGRQRGGSGVEGTGVEWRGGTGRAGQGRVPDCLGRLSKVGISSRSTRPWNGQPPSTPNKNGAHDDRVLLFQVLSPHGRDHSRTRRPSLPVAGAATDLRHRCHKCGKHFSGQDTLRVHLAMHDGKYPYHCQYCGRGFAATNNLKGHLAKHTGVKAFPCLICKKAFSYSNVLKYHVRKFHSDLAP